MEHSSSIAALAAALAKAQGIMGGALKGSENPYFKSKYADLESVWEACREPLANNGLAVIQGDSADDAGVMVTTMLVHESGEWIKSTLRMVPKDLGPQAIGSCISYARRYALASMVGIYQSDDDAEKGSGRGNGEISHPSDILTPEKRNRFLPEVVKAIEANDVAALKAVVDRLNEGEQRGVWSFLNTKQKTAAREMMQRKEVVKESLKADEYVRRFREALDTGIVGRVLELHEECNSVPEFYLEVSALLTVPERKRINEAIAKAAGVRG